MPASLSPHVHAARPAIGAGFADPVFGAQAAFRAILDATAAPGTVVRFAEAVGAPDDLPRAAAVSLLTLADYDTPLFLDPARRMGAAGDWLRFHTGARLTDETAEAAFALVDPAQSGDRVSLADFHPGEDRYPDRSATVFVLVDGFQGGPVVRLTGPGIETERLVSPSGLPETFWQEAAMNSRRYPLGIDLFLVSGAELMAVPRSTAIESPAAPTPAGAV